MTTVSASDAVVLPHCEGSTCGTATCEGEGSAETVATGSATGASGVAASA